MGTGNLVHPLSFKNIWLIDQRLFTLVCVTVWAQVVWFGVKDQSRGTENCHIQSLNKVSKAPLPNISKFHTSAIKEQQKQNKTKKQNRAKQTKKQTQLDIVPQHQSGNLLL